MSRKGERKSETTPSNRLVEAIRPELQKFVPRMTLAGDGLVITAFLHEMGASFERLLNTEALPNTTARNVHRHVQKLLKSKDIFDAISDSDLEPDVQIEMLELLSKKRIEDAQGAEAKATARRERELARERWREKREGLQLLAFRKNRPAVLHAADMLLNGAFEWEILDALKDEFGFTLPTHSVMHNAFGDPIRLVQTAYPEKTEEEIRKTLGNLNQRSTQKGHDLRRASIKSAIPESGILPSLEEQKDFSRALALFIRENRKGGGTITVGDMLKVYHQYSVKKSFASIAIVINLERGHETKARGWFDYLSQQLEEWTRIKDDPHADTETCFDAALIQFNEKRERIKCVIDLRSSGVNVKTHFYETSSQQGS